MKSAAAYAEEEEEGTKDVHSYHHSIMLIVIKTSNSYTAEWGGGAGKHSVLHINLHIEHNKDNHQQYWKIRQQGSIMLRCC